MWKKAENLEDIVKALEIKELGDPQIYKLSETKGAIAYTSQSLLARVQSGKLHIWLYEDGANRITFGFSIDDTKPSRIEWFSATGFDPDPYANMKLAFPIALDKIREFADSIGISKYYAVSPRTRDGELKAYFVQAYLWEATVSLMPDGMGWRIDVDRSNKASVPDESKYEVKRTPTVDADHADSKQLASLREVKADKI